MLASIRVCMLLKFIAFPTFTRAAATVPAAAKADAIRSVNRNTSGSREKMKLLNTLRNYGEGETSINR